MFQLADKIPDENVIGFLLGGMGIISGTIVIVTAIVARNWSRSQQRQVAAPLIREMVERGMSSRDIAEVFAVAFDDRPARRRLREAMRSLTGKERAVA
ncbi:MAG: hypothetical protein M3552_12330 [Planctomycetota bacterium]|nr:hypothetical protein [Planctomycetota bacterium]